VGALGRKQCGGLFLLADDLLNLTALHAQLAVSVAEMLPISIATLFSDEAKRLAGSTEPGTPRTPDTPGQPGTPQQQGATSFHRLMNSPWKVGLLAFSPVWNLFSGVVQPTFFSLPPGFVGLWQSERAVWFHRFYLVQSILLLLIFNSSDVCGCPHRQDFIHEA
jgi:hypothetical protein